MNQNLLIVSPVYCIPCLYTFIILCGNNKNNNSNNNDNSNNDNNNNYNNNNNNNNNNNSNNNDNENNYNYKTKIKILLPEKNNKQHEDRQIIKYTHSQLQRFWQQ